MFACGPATGHDYPVSTQEKTAPSRGGFAQSLDSFFQISKRGSTIGSEIRGGIVTFFAMAYILVVNPAILGNAVPEDGSITTQGRWRSPQASASTQLSPSPWFSAPASATARPWV